MKMNARDNAPSSDEFDDVTTDEENQHDQLPSPEEYRANSGNISYNDSTMSVDDTNTGEDEHEHDLPSVDEYKRDLSFRQEERPTSRAGLYTFLCLIILLIIVTAIAVPVSLRSKNNGGGSPGQVVSGTGKDIPAGPPHQRITATPVSFPTNPPSPPPTQSFEVRARNYILQAGLSDQMTLKDLSTPQGKAFHWIVNEDTYDIEIDDIQHSTGGNQGVPYHATRFAERWSLAVFFYSTGGDEFGWRYKLNFLQPIDHCDWFERFVDGIGNIIKQGVTECKQFAPKFDGEKVSKIEISNNKLMGSIPTEIKFLPYMSTWITPFNADLTTTDSLGPFLPLADRLVHLELQYCGISGTIPEKFGDMTKLNYLGLGNNYLQGLIPDSFFNLSNLIVLGLDDNLLQSPFEKFVKFNSIQKLYIEDNMITGQITQEMLNGGWENMVDLDASVNRLEGPLPANIWSMSNLEVLDLHGNDFVGEIPEINEVHENLIFFAVQDNSLDWKIPSSIDKLVNLQHLDVSGNSFVIPFPESMSKLTNLKSLYTGINGFDEHPIPDFLAGMTNLVELSMKQNKLTGEIPTFFGRLTNLQVLDLDFNQLRGRIPSELGMLVSMDHLLLNRNYLSGTIPTTFMNLVDADVLLLDSNNITGTADVICLNANINASVFTSDCATTTPEISCSCCTLCCQDSDLECNNLDWRINLDGIWEYDFQRVVYDFSQEMMPASAKEQYAGGN